MSLVFLTANFLMLLAGIILTIITVRRMVTGAISIPRWAKLLLITGMLLIDLICLLCILPTAHVNLSQNEPVESIPSQTVEAAQ